MKTKAEKLRAFYEKETHKAYHNMAHEWITAGDEQIQALLKAKEYGEMVREFVRAEVERQITEQVFEVLKDQTERDIRIYHLMAQVDSMEKSIKDANKKITAIRNQLRKEKGREKLS